MGGDEEERSCKQKTGEAPVTLAAHKVVTSEWESFTVMEMGMSRSQQNS